MFETGFWKPLACSLRWALETWTQTASWGYVLKKLQKTKFPKKKPKKFTRLYRCNNHKQVAIFWQMCSNQSFADKLSADSSCLFLPHWVKKFSPCKAPDFNETCSGTSNAAAKWCEEFNVVDGLGSSKSKCGIQLIHKGAKNNWPHADI